MTVTILEKELVTIQNFNKRDHTLIKSSGNESSAKKLGDLHVPQQEKNARLNGSGGFLNVPTVHVVSPLSSQTATNELQTIYDQVNETLSKDEVSRNNDKFLILKVWESYGITNNLTQEQLEYLPSPETITRIRRKIQNDEQRLQATEETIEEREIHTQKIKELVSH